MKSELWVPSSARGDILAKRADAPKTGNQYGSWAGRDTSYLQLPGGAAMAFDLSKLTLADFRQMRDHYQIAISLYLLSFMMHQIDWRIEGGNAKQNTFVEEEIRGVWTQMVRAFSQGHWAGFSPMVIDWANGTPANPNRIGIERVKDLIPEDCFVNWEPVYGAVQSNGFRPRFWEYDGIVQCGAGSRWGSGPSGSNLDPIPADSTIWYTLLMENGDYYGRKLLRPAFAPWFFSTLMHLFSNRYYERFGEPLPVGRADFDDSLEIDGEEVDGREAMFRILENIRSRSQVVLPSERVPWGDGSKSDYAYSIEYLESQMRGADFDRYMTRLDEEISLSLFTPLLMVRTADVGSYNLGQTHSQAYLWMLNSLAGDMQDHIQKFLVDPLIRFNWGANGPKIKFKYRSLGKDNAELLRTIVMEIISAGEARPNLQQVAEAVGIDFEKIVPLTAPQNGAPPHPGAPGAPVPPGGQKVVDNRVGRPERKTPKGMQKQIAARVQRQLEKHRREGGEFKPDIGYRRQVAEHLGVEQSDLDATYSRLSTWLVDVAASDLAVSEVMTYFANLADTQLCSAA